MLYRYVCTVKETPVIVNCKFFQQTVSYAEKVLWKIISFYDKTAFYCIRSSLLLLERMDIQMLFSSLV